MFVTILSFFFFLHMQKYISCSIIDDLHLLENNDDGLIWVPPHTEILPLRFLVTYVYKSLIHRPTVRPFAR